MLYKTLSAAVYGIDASIIEVEVDVSGIKCDEDHFHTVGLPDAAVRESRDRVRAALKNCGYDIPPTHIAHQPGPDRHQERRFRLRPTDGAGHFGSVWRVEQEGDYRLPVRRRTLARWRSSRCSGRPPHRHRGS